MVRAAAELKPDAIVVDIAMPILNGLDATQRWRRYFLLSKWSFYHGWRQKARGRSIPLWGIGLSAKSVSHGRTGNRCARSAAANCTCDELFQKILSAICCSVATKW